MFALFAVALLCASTTLAADVTAPSRVADVTLLRSANDVQLAWSSITTDRNGQAETVDFYRIYRGTTPDFTPDKLGGSNLVGTSLTPDYTDLGDATSGIDRYYRVTAVDLAGNESNSLSSTIDSAPVLSGSWTANSVEVNWTPAEPQANVVSYRLYYGKSLGVYEDALDVGTNLASSLTSLDLLSNYYVQVSAIDAAGNESELSNYHVDAIAGTVEMTVWQGAHHCFSAACDPAQPGQIQQDARREIVQPVTFPEGDWVNVELNYANYSDALLDTGCVWPDGGGDIFDRTASVYLVTDPTCIGARCYGDRDNIELLRVVTPFGTDDTTGPRQHDFDVTVYAKLMSGEMHVGAWVDTFDPNGWFTDVKFRFTEDPAQASPTPPADGVEPLFFHQGGQLPYTEDLTIPLDATQVFMRVFITGHGATGPTGICDEFCQKLNSLTVNGARRWSTIPWRDDCSPAGNSCSNWNACGFPSCTFDRAGWCPGYVACHSSDPNCDQDVNLTPFLLPGVTNTLGWLIQDIEDRWEKSVAIYWYE